MPPFVIQIQLKGPIGSVFCLRRCKECSIHLRSRLWRSPPAHQRPRAGVAGKGVRCMHREPLCDNTCRIVLLERQAV